MEVGENAACGGDVPFFDVGDGASAFFDGGQEVEHVTPCGWGGKEFDVLFGDILGVLVAFVNAIPVNRFAFAAGDEVVLGNAGFEGSLVSIKCQGPGIVLVRRIAPGAVLPDDGEVVVFEGGVLGIRNVRLAFLLDEDTAGRADLVGPAEFEHPARRVEHVNAHVADDAVAVFPEGSPPAFVGNSVVGSQGCGAGPHFVVEEIGNGLEWRIAVRPHVVVAAKFGVGDVAEQTRVDNVFLGFDEMGSALSLGADLNDAVVLASGGEHGFAFHDVDADRFLHVDMGTGLDGVDHLQGMPVVGAADEDDVQVLFGEHLAVVGVGSGDLARLLTLADEFGGVGEHVGIHIADGDHVNGRNLDQSEHVVLAVPAGADQADAFGFRMDDVHSGGPQGRHGQGRGRGLQKTSAIDVEAHDGSLFRQ